jgi:hypothetical protein
MKTICFLEQDVKLKQLLLFVVVFLFSLGINAQSINFNYSDGTNASYNVIDVEKITFTGDVMNLHFLNGNIYTWNVSIINKYTYDNNSLNIEQPTNNAWQVLVYPNPTTSSLNIKFILPKEDDIKLNIFDIQGKLVLEKNLGKINTGEFLETIDLINVSPGTYICKITGYLYSLTKKIIKQ